MVFVRVIVLAFLAFYSWSMGQLPPHELNGFGKLVSAAFFVFGPALYFLPVYEAWRRNHRSFNAIAILNVFLGWTLIGWVAAMAWACKSQVQEVEVVHTYTPAPSPAPVPSSSSLSDELRKLAQLRDDGILSESEFQAQKAKLLV